MPATRETAPVDATRQTRGRVAYYAGLCAEDQIARHYCRRGYRLDRRRWRGRAGEIDLILRDGAQVVFVEVKKSSSVARAAERLSGRQMQRIIRAAEEYICTEADGYETEMRIDVAFVGSRGEMQIIENASLDF